MSWLSIVLFIMTHIPDMISIIQEILNLIHGLPIPERAMARRQIADAIHSGDHEAIRNVVMGVHQQCTTACPSDLKTE